MRTSPRGSPIARSSLRTLAALLLLLQAQGISALGDKNQTTNPPPQAARGVQPTEPKFRVVRSVAGTKGSEQGGRFVIEDPRTVFYIPEDKQVMVYFEWEGPSGPHQFEGIWKNPEGKVVVVSEFKYEATQRRFGGYWVLMLTDALQPGLWALEARVDGELAGAHTIQIVIAPRPASAIPERKLLTPSEIYQQAVAATVFIEKLVGTGERVATGSGFFLAQDLVLTAFQVIDGANSLRLLFPDGRRVETNAVVAWHRRQDWAILKVESGQAPVLKRAKPDSWAVGDRCFSLNSPAEGNRVIVDGNIIGTQNSPDAGPRLNLNFSLASEAIGSPLLNEYGEVIAVVGGSLIPGSWSLKGRWGYGGAVSDFFPGGLAVPISQLPTPPTDSPPVLLDELSRSGQFVQPLVRDEYISLGRLARGLERQGPVPLLVDAKSEFSRKDGQVVLLVTWEPRVKRRGRAYFRTYDLDNRIVIDSKPGKIDLKPGHLFDTAWKLSLGTLQPGVYRIDVFVDQDPVWRTFLRIIE